jgi:ion channel-forming bestrophin family protein
MEDDGSISTRSLLRGQLGGALVLMSLSVAVVTAEELTGEVGGLLPDVPVTVLGAAIGIYVSFRTNSAYERWWEGRKLWGQLVNTSRHLCAQLFAYLPDQAASTRLTERHILYVHSLRCELRREPVRKDPDVQRLTNGCPDEPLEPPALTTRILRRQLRELAALHRAGALDARQLQSFDQSLATLLDVQGGCERIRNTPLPPSYGRIAELLIRTHAVVLPLAIVDDLHWLALPVSVVICMAFRLINEVGRTLENPFTRDRDALPLHAISLTIEQNLSDALGLPPPPKPQRDPRGVLL